MGASKRLLVGLVGSLVVAGAAAASVARIHLVVSPSVVDPGAVIRVSAASSPCPVGDQVILISRAFRGHAYGEGAVYGRVGRHGAFSVSTRISAPLAAGRYEVGARCGGGHLPVGAVFAVR
jgi:hypothetical protein